MDTVDLPGSRLPAAFWRAEVMNPGSGAFDYNGESALDVDRPAVTPTTRAGYASATTAN
jgi:hypothetical protein